MKKIIIIFIIIFGLCVTDSFARDHRHGRRGCNNNNTDMAISAFGGALLGAFLGNAAGQNRNYYPDRCSVPPMRDRYGVPVRQVTERFWNPGFYTDRGYWRPGYYSYKTFNVPLY
jgi:hypothetical protein